MTSFPVIIGLFGAQSILTGFKRKSDFNRRKSMVF